MQVNENNLVGADHYFAVEVLKNSGSDITMVISREKEPIVNSHSPVRTFKLWRGKKMKIALY